MPNETLELSDVMSASPERVYRAWLDAKEHTAMTGAETVIQNAIGAAFQASDGYIVGMNLDLEPNRRIVQSWRTSEFPAGAPHSKLEILFDEAPDGGTRVTLHHTDIPEGQAEQYREGWESYYFAPMKEYFATHGEHAADETTRVPAASAELLESAQRELPLAAPAPARKPAAPMRAVARPEARPREAARREGRRSGEGRCSDEGRCSGRPPLRRRPCREGRQGEGAGQGRREEGAAPAKAAKATGAKKKAAPAKRAAAAKKPAKKVAAKPAKKAPAKKAAPAKKPAAKGKAASKRRVGIAGCVPAPRMTFEATCSLSAWPSSFGSRASVPTRATEAPDSCDPGDGSPNRLEWHRPRSDRRRAARREPAGIEEAGRAGWLPQGNARRCDLSGRIGPGRPA